MKGDWPACEQSLKALEREGYEVSAYTGKAEAMEAFGERLPDLVILDVILPGKSGLDLLVTIRQHERWSSVPIVVLTGNDSIVQDNGRTYLRGHDLERGPDCVLAKPVDQEELIECLSRLTDSPDRR